MSLMFLDNPSLQWFGRGMRGIFSLPAFILMISFIGFSAFAVESGVSRGEAVFMTLSIWALPAKVILVGSMASGAGLLACFLAVTLSSIRMMPMVASLIPDLKTEKTPVWKLLIVSHFVAITAWVFATQNLINVPREHRIAWFAGFGSTLTVANTAIVALCYGVVSTFPPVVAGVLFFLTPVYFIGSIWVLSRQTVTKVAFIIGVIGGPLTAALIPEFDILIAGLGGGTLAYLIDRYVLRPRRKTNVGAKP
jgi:predicted branched-subunit amino acid permease